MQFDQKEARDACWALTRVQGRGYPTCTQSKAGHTCHRVAAGGCHKCWGRVVPGAKQQAQHCDLLQPEQRLRHQRHTLQQQTNNTVRLCREAEGKERALQYDSHTAALHKCQQMLHRTSISTCCLPYAWQGIDIRV
jgi:hypothetical protein